MARKRVTKAGQRSARGKSCSRKGYAVEQLETRIFLDSSAFAPVAGDFAGKLTQIEQGIETASSLAGSVPLLRDQLGTLSNLDVFDTTATNQVRTALATITDQAGLSNSLTTVFNALGFQTTVVAVAVDSNASTLSFTLNLHKDLYSASAAVNMDVGLSGLPLGISSQANVNIALAMDEQQLKFTFDANANPTYTFTPGTLKFTVDAKLDKASSLTGKLGFLKGTITNQENTDATKKTEFLGEFDVDPVSLTTKLVGNADLNLHLALQAGNQFPSIGADLNLHWSFDNGQSSGSAPTLSYDNVTLNLGGFLTGVLKPMLQDIQGATRPYQPLVNILTYPLPGISDLSNLLGQGNINLLTLAKIAADASQQPQYQAIAQLATVVTQVVGTINAIDLNSANGAVINFGHFSVGTAKPGEDLRNVPLVDEVVNGGPGFISDVGSLLRSVADGGDVPQSLKDSVGNMTAQLNPQQQTVATFGFKVPLFDEPAYGVFKLLLGQQPALATFNAKFAGNGSSGIPPIDLYGLHGGFSGSVGVDASFSAGYDTQGLLDYYNSGNPDDLLHGFYLGDDTHLDLTGNVTANIGVGAVFFSVDLSGGITGTLGLDLHDPDYATDGGLLRWYKIDPAWLFNGNGSIGASLSVDVKVGVKVPLVGFVGVEHTFGPFGGAILSFASGGASSNSWPEPPQTKVPLYANPPTPVLASRAPDGTLTLLMGPTINLNGISRNVDPVDGDENFEVQHLGGVAGNETVRVIFHDKAGGLIHDYSQDISNVSSIVALGGQGNNTIMVDSGVLSPADLTGGVGNNAVVYSGSGNATLTAGGNGQNTLIGGSGDDNFYTGNGKSLMIGGAGADWFHCSGGDDTIYGGDGNDIITGGTGAEHIDAGRGDNTVIGGPGINTITVHTGDGNQTIFGGTGTQNTLAVIGESGAGMNTMTVGAGTGADASAVVVQTATGKITASGVQTVTMEGDGGPASITVNSVAGTPVQSIGVGLGQLTSAGGNGLADSLVVNGEANDNLQVQQFTDLTTPLLNGVPNPNLSQLQPAIEITGMTAKVILANPPGDALVLNAGAGNHVIGIDVPTLGGALIVNAGSGLNQVSVTGAAGPTTINTSGANNIVNVLANSGGLVINVPAAGDVVNVGDPSGPGLANITGPVNVQAGSSPSTTLNLNDAVDTVGRSGTVSATTTTGLGMSGAGAVLYSGIKALNVWLGSGGDAVNIPSVPSGAATHIDGNAGNDSIDASAANGPLWITDGAGADTIAGSNYNDTIAAGNGVDSIHGNDGADSITVGAGNDWIDAGAGNDTISAGNGGSYIAGGTGDDSITAGDGPNTIYGNNDNDRIVVGGGNNSIDGGAGNDTITAGNGGNTIAGGTESDTITAGDGPNIVYGNDGGDVITVGRGKNWVSTGAGNDSVTAGDGGNYILGGSGNDTIVTGDGPDIVYGVAGNNTINTGAGNDTVDAGSGNSTVTGGGGDDLLVQNANTNQVLTNSTLTGFGTTTFTGFRRVALTGGPGNISFDVSAWTGGPVAIVGGGGDDTVSSSNNVDFILGDGSLRRGDGVVFSLSGIASAALTGGAGDNTFDVSHWTGQATLTGAGGDDGVISVVDGNATITNTLLTRSRRGAISLSGITRADLTGGAGDNNLDASGFSHGVTLNGGAGNDTLLGSAFDDSLCGGTGNDSIVTNGGNDLVDASAGGGDTINLGSGYETVYGSSAGDVVTGATSADLIYEQPATTPLLPTPDPLANEAVPGATLPTGPDTRGQWIEFASSASGGGVSNSSGSAVDAAVTAASAGQFVAWADNRSGRYQIYVAQHTASGWQELGGSAHGGGISNSTGAARQPSITLDGSGNPIVTWVNTAGETGQILAARYVPGSNAWVALGSAIAVGAVSRPRVVNTSGGPVVAWLDGGGGITNVNASSFNGSTWSAPTNVSQSAISVTDLNFATDGTNVAAVWTQPTLAGTRIYLKQLSGGTWSDIGGSASGDGVGRNDNIDHPTVGYGDQPTVAYHSGQVFVAWRSLGMDGTSAPVIVASTYSGLAWVFPGIDTPQEASHVATRGAAGAPQLADNNGNLDLVWLDDRQPDAPGQAVAIYANRLVGAAFVRQLPGDAANAGIQPGSAGVSGVAVAVDPAGHPFVAWSDTSGGSPQIYFRGDTLDIHRVYYVNDSLAPSDSFTTAAGNAANDGLSPATPKDSVSSVLNSYTLQSGDIVLVDSGTTPAFTAAAVGSSYLVVGSTGVQSILSGTTTLTGTQGVTLINLALGNVNLTSANNASLINDNAAAIAISGGSGVQVAHGSAASVSLTGLNDASDVEWGSFGAGSVSGGSNLLVRGDRLTTLSITGAASGTITGNMLSASGTILTISAPFTGSIDNNYIHGGNIGVALSAAAPLVANSIFGNTTGVTASATGSSGLGFAAGSGANEIYGNTTGVYLTGAMQEQHVWGNTTGITGTGTLGGNSLDTANLIDRNSVGVNFTGTIQFNQIACNGVGIQTAGGQVVIHNVIYRNLTAGIETAGASDVRIANNSLYATVGNNVQVDGGSSNVQVLDNIAWATSGYDLYVADNSRGGFFSDYNDLFTTAGGKVAHWLVDFGDVLDWQVTLDRFDLHSIGTTAVNPTFAMPRFVGPAGNDYRVQDPQTTQRQASPTIGTGAPWTDLGVPSTYMNLLANPSFESGVANWTVSTGATTQTSSPTPFNGSAYYYAGGVASGFAQQTISLTDAGFTAAQLDGQGLVAVFGGRVRSAAENPADQGQIVFTFLDGSGAAIGTPDTVPASNLSDRWELIGDRLHIPAGTRSITYRFQSLRETGSTNDAFLDNAFVYVLPSSTATDMGAYGNTTSHPSQPSASIHLGYPDLYVDWELTTSHNVQWSTFGSAGSPVNIDLYQDDNTGTPQLLSRIASTVPDTGHYAWIPQNSGLSYGTYGLRIQVSLAANPLVYDRSEETFTVPENGHSYYLNDGSPTGDVYTSAIGSNRNDGKTPARPKPLLTSLLRIYNPGALDTINVDTGTYNHFDPVVLSGNPLVGTGQGVTIIGPTSPANVAQIFPLGFTGPAVFDINSGNYVNLSHLTISGGDYGVWVRNASTNFTGSYLTLIGNRLDGVRLESDSSTNAALDHLTAASNGRDGISIGGQGVSLTNSIAHDNVNAGIRFDNAGGVAVTGNQSYLNKYGVAITNAGGNPVATVGNTDLTRNLGNIVHDNTSYGISASGPIVVAGNTAYNAGAPGSAVGINLSSGASATENVVYGTYRGIYSNSGGTAGITYNRVFDTSGTGIYASNSTIATGNVIYANVVGLEGDTSPTWSNNLIYADSTAGIWYHGSAFGVMTKILNNTVYLTGDGIRVEAGGSGTISVRNNIVWTQNGYDLTVTPQAESELQSDYNDLYVTGTGQVGRWEDTGRSTMQAWRLASYTDFNSISADPQFVSAAGADGMLGFVGSITDGNDDEFHEQSIAGSFHGGALAPLAMSAGSLPSWTSATLTSDSANSPALDRGDPTSSYSSEPAPNGGFVNLGTYGNTAQASESTVPYVLVLSPTGGETIIEGETFMVTWRAEVTAGTVNIDLMDGGLVVQSIATGVANNGSYAWSVPTALTPGSYTIRISRTTPSPSSGSSLSPFNIVSPVHTFYVNDSAFEAGDFSSAAGDDSNNSGLDPAHPKASIRAILQAYSLVPGDVIDVDAGNYTLSNNIAIPANRSGITIRGFSDPGNPTHVAVINRNTTAANMYVFDLQGATNVTLDHLTLVGSDIAVNLANSAGSTGLTLSNSEIYGSATSGVYIGTADNGALVTGNRIHDAGRYGVGTLSTQATISDNVIYNATAYGIDVASGNNSTISGNTVYGCNTGIYAESSTISGNIAYNNGTAGIAMAGGLAIGNTTYNNTLPGNYANRAGILLYGGTVQGNISYGNRYGILVPGGGTMTGNLLYNNTSAGAWFSNGSVFNQNVCYGNGWGVAINSNPSAQNQGPSLSNNLVYGNLIGGIQLIGGNHTPITNNTVYQTIGDALQILDNGGNGSKAVDVRNNILWTAGGLDISVDPTSQPNVTSDYNDLYVTGTGNIGRWGNIAYSSLSAWQNASFLDANSISADPLFVDPVNGDFHEQSLSGSYHGGSQAPVLAGNGLPTPATATLTVDTNQSPAIDRGDATSTYSTEPTPNGGYINQGAFGNTNQASKSPSSYVIVTQPSGGQTWIEGSQTYTITWRDASIGTGSVNIDLMTWSDGAASLQSSIVAGVTNNGRYSWTPSASIPPASNYLIRVTQQGGASALSPAVFSLAPQVHTFYVNDATVQAGDWTTAPGNDANSGLDAAHPKASINSLLANYNIGAGDTIKIDAGIYTMAADVVLTSAYSGLTFQGYNDPAYPTRQAVLSRGSVSGSSDFRTNGAANITIQNLVLTGATYAFQSTNGVASNNTTITNSIITGTSSYAVYILGGADNFTFTNNLVHDNDGGLYIGSIANLTFTGNTLYNHRLCSLYATPKGGLISGNVVHHSGNIAAGVYAGDATLITVSNNVIHDNPTIGLAIAGNVLAIGNTIYNTTNNNAGIKVGGSAEARSNLVYNNTTGIYVNGGLADLNRVYGNTADGIFLDGGTATQNQVYGNATGIETNSSTTISNNIVYANTTRGIYVSAAYAPQIINNTVYQPTGDALYLISGSYVGSYQPNIRDNIFWAQAGYDLNMNDDGAVGLISDYNDLYVTGAGKVARISSRDYPALSDWVYEYGLDMHSISVDPQFLNIVGPDGILGYSGSVDHGADDNFHLQSTSAGIDTGDPTLLYFNEPMPNGGRINMGSYGNTSQADLSPAAQSVQITSPGNFQKLEAGHPYTLSWQTNGVVANQPVLLMNAGGPAVGYWTANAYTSTNNNYKTVTNTIDTSGVIDPAPPQVYQSYAWPNSGSEVAYQLPVKDGSYAVRLDFMDDLWYIGKPFFSIKVNGTVVNSSYDVFAAAGGAGYKATAVYCNTTASGGTGVLVEVIKTLPNYSVISGIELSAPNPNPVPSPTANLQVSTDSGSTWTTIATNQRIDSYGRGSFQWTPTVTTTGPTALFRVLVNNTSLAATSQPFAIYNGGTDYYVNDGSQAGDSLTTAPGNNANSGKSPDSPLADIQAVLSQYNPGAGATIHVDAGTYTLVHNLTLTAINSGLKIQGPSNAAAVIDRATTNRNNGYDNPFVFKASASNITLDHLSITGGYYGVFADYGAYAVNNVISNSQLYSNAAYGIYLGRYNTGWLITGNTVHDNAGPWPNPGKGIDLEATYGTISNNKVYNQWQVGILLTSADGSTVSGNEVYANATGIQPIGNMLVSNNLVHDNTSYGIAASYSTLVTANTVYRQTASGADGIYLSQSAEARGNTVYYNYNGIVAGNGNYATIDRNDVYSNTNYGIWLNSATGILADNLVYANSAAGIVLNSAGSEQICGNTVYQPIGDAIRFTNSANASVRSNILWVEAGYDLDVTDTASQSGFISDYNDLYRGLAPSAHVGYWGGIQDQLSNWQGASSKDPTSLASDPLFLSAKGADQVLGYSTSGAGYNGGADDNFYLSAGSPALDRGYTWAGYATDILNQPRLDDPGTTNAGSNDYVATDTGTSQFAVSGTAMNWRAGVGNSWSYTFTGGFTFPFYGTTYTSVYVGNGGLLQFAGPDSSAATNNSDATLLADVRIAPLWAPLRTDLTGNNIYIDTSVSGQVKFTWVASNSAGTAPANFSAVLFNTGQIRFDYGTGNANLAPTIGISEGDKQHATFLSYDGSTNLANASSILLGFQPGFVDMGAYEFAGSSLDTTPPTLTATSPTPIQSGGIIGPTDTLSLTFSEPINFIDANAPSDYQLVSAGPDSQFDTADDTIYSLTPTCAPGSNLVTLKINGAVPSFGAYRITVFGSSTGGLHDSSGLLLDGNADGTAGGNFVRTFTIANTVPAVSSPSTASITAGSTFSASGSFADPDAGDLWTATVDYGDGTGIQPLGLAADKTFALNHSFSSPGNKTVTVSVSDKAGAVGTATIAVTVTDLPGLVRDPGASYTLTGSSGNQVLSVTAGTITFNGDLGAASPNVRVAVGSGATLILNATQHLGGLTLTGGGKAQIQAGSKAVLELNSLALDANSSLDLNDGDLALSYANGQGDSALAQVVGLLTSGRHNGAWDGPGICSTAANLNPNASLGVVNNTPTGGATRFTTFGGQAVDAQSILVRYTLVGDSNLDGTVNFTDLVAVAQHYNGNGTWETADFNYDGAINFADLVNVAQHYNQTLPSPASTASVSGSGSATTAVSPATVNAPQPDSSPVSQASTAASDGSISSPASIATTADTAITATPLTSAAASTVSQGTAQPAVPSTADARANTPVRPVVVPLPAGQPAPVAQRSAPVRTHATRSAGTKTSTAHPAAKTTFAPAPSAQRTLAGIGVERSEKSKGRSSNNSASVFAAPARPISLSTPVALRDPKDSPSILIGRQKWNSVFR